MTLAGTLFKHGTRRSKRMRLCVRRAFSTERPADGGSNERPKDLRQKLSFDNDTHDSAAMTPSLHQEEKKTTTMRHYRRTKLFAVLVDSENAQRHAMHLIMRKVQDTFGEATVRRVYGDFSLPSGQYWKEICLKHSLVPIQVFTYVQGKGNVDAALMLDAMELLLEHEIDGFCIVSSDSDFTRLAQILREKGKHVVGFGHEHTPESLVQSCQDFVYVNELIQQEIDEEEAVLRKQQEKALEERRRKEALQKEKEEKDVKEEEHSTVWERLSLFWTSSFGAKKIESETFADANKTANKDDSPTSSVPKETLDALHEGIQKHSDDFGDCLLSVLAAKTKVDYDSFGYEKFSLLIADHPNEFELKREGAGIFFVRSTKTFHLDRLHDCISKVSDENGWAIWGLIAKEVDLSNIGVSKFSKLAGEYPDEFETSINGPTALVKSLRR